MEGCNLDVFCDYLKRRTEHVRVGHTSSLMGSLLFCLFKNPVAKSLKFSDPYISSDDLKIFAIENAQKQLQSDLK